MGDRGQNRAPQWLIWVGGTVFVIVLAVSAYFEADIRWLHFFQAFMYLIPMALATRSNKWALFIGLSAAGLWDYANLFATTFFINGLQQLAAAVHTGKLARPDLAIAVPAWLGNLLVVIGCLWVYFRLDDRRWSDLARFLLTFALTTGYFALDMWLFQPRYLPLFRSMIHPHLQF
jgi:hypothetical protein